MDPLAFQTPAAGSGPGTGTPPALPRLPRVDVPSAAPPGGQPSGLSRLPPIGALAAAGALVGAVVLLAAALVGAPPFAAVATPTPSPSPTAVVSASPSPTTTPSPPSARDLIDILARIERRISEIRGLASGEPSDPKLLTTAEASQILVADFRLENPPDFLADQTALYRALGLLGPDEDLGAAFERFLSTQVLGFYRSSDRSLYVVSDQAFGPLQELTAAHEYTHALQDASFGLDALTPEGHDQGDLALARLALIEGDATLAMIQWAVEELTPKELSDLLDDLQDPIAQRAFEDAPAILRETQTFPYARGVEFVQRTWLEGGWTAVDALWRDPPSTTEQVLHVEKYDSGEAALAVELPEGVAAALGDGWRLVLEDTHGELVTRIWLETGNAPIQAADAAAGWGGDRAGLYRGPNAAWALLWITRWDSRAEAVEFREGALGAVAGLPLATVAGEGTTVTIAVASDASFLDRLAEPLP